MRGSMYETLTSSVPVVDGDAAAWGGANPKPKPQTPSANAQAAKRALRERRKVCLLLKRRVPTARVAALSGRGQDAVS
jgi:hypothetical protein